jgi:hypothetical protein
MTRLEEKDVNVTIVKEEDKEFIRTIMGLSHEKKTLLKGIVAGLALQLEQFNTTKGERN